MSATKINRAHVATGYHYTLYAESSREASTSRSTFFGNSTFCGLLEHYICTYVL